jgi:hypothetical protein
MWFVNRILWLPRQARDRCAQDRLYFAVALRPAATVCARRDAVSPRLKHGGRGLVSMGAPPRFCSFNFRVCPDVYQDCTRHKASIGRLAPPRFCSFNFRASVPSFSALLFFQFPRVSRHISGLYTPQGFNRAACPSRQDCRAGPRFCFCSFIFCAFVLF